MYATRSSTRGAAGPQTRLRHRQERWRLAKTLATVLIGSIQLGAAAPPAARGRSRGRGAGAPFRSSLRAAFDASCLSGAVHVGDAAPARGGRGRGGNAAPAGVSSPPQSIPIATALCSKPHMITVPPP